MAAPQGFNPIADASDMLFLLHVLHYNSKPTYNHMFEDQISPEKCLGILCICQIKVACVHRSCVLQDQTDTDSEILMPASLCQAQWFMLLEWCKIYYSDMRWQTQPLAYKNWKIRGEGGQKTMIQVQMYFSDPILWDV